MANIADYIRQLQILTERNLEILQGINDSFFNKQNHMSINVGNKSFAMPSFISLENRINMLEENFKNIIEAPKHGEAFVNMDGNSREIVVRGYTHTPNHIELPVVEQFGTEHNNIFKDFLTPVPYLNFVISYLPNDITSLVYKKVIPQNKELLDVFKKHLKDSCSIQFDWAKMTKILSIYRKDIDYVEYDMVKKLPIRKNIGSGIYVIESILGDHIDENMDEYITLKFRSDIPGTRHNLTYLQFDETIARPLKVGDQLVTYDDSAKMEIVDIQLNTNTVQVRICNGEYLNLAKSNPDKTELKDISDICKLRFYSPVNFENDKYIHIPLEEDQYVFIALAQLNDRMNVQSSWGTGLLLNTFKLISDNGTNQNFESYYKESVNNIGDTLNEITSALKSPVSSLSPLEFKALHESVPVVNPDNLQVVQINKHLNDSEAVKNIRSLYSQKKRYNTQLQEIQTSIDNINQELASISFDDTSGMRAAYTAQLSEYNTKKNELITSMIKIVDEISLSANNSEVPIENAKYHIRGFFDYKDFETSIKEARALGHTVGIRVQYRYKNIDAPQGQAQTINDKFLFSDWNEMETVKRLNLSDFKDKYIFGLEPDNSSKNEPSFNQIDIPITQGEHVDIRLQVIYDYGYPISYTVSQWSEIVTIDFPKEFIKDVQVMDIIKENNNDIETNRFNNILREQGIPDHIGDRIVDQDIVYLHKPENISSGFYTDERRIIPLRDKLAEMDALMTELKDEILGTNADSLSVSIINGDVANKLYPYQNNPVGAEAYNVFDVEKPVAPNTEVELISEKDGVRLINPKLTNGTYSYDMQTKIVSTVYNIVITNTSKHTVKIFSLFPGPKDKTLNELIQTKFDKTDFCANKNQGVWLLYDEKTEKGNKTITKASLQTANQFITFRIKDAYDGTKYYESSATADSILLPLKDSSYLDTAEYIGSNTGSILYPRLREQYSLCLKDDSVRTYLTLAPGAELVIPIIFDYKVKPNEHTSKTMSFDLRTSLYEDPVHYTFTVTAKYDNTTQDKLITTNRRLSKDNKYHTTVVK